MEQHDFLINALIYLAAAVIAVPIFKRFGLASVLGYLAAGSVIGPFGLRLIRNVESTMGFAEFGVVLLLFIIGLELKPSRLWVLRKSVFGLGGAQVLFTALPFTLIAIAFNLPLKAAIIVAISLAFSSTAFALQILAEKKQLSSQAGRSSFAILLFQDLAAIPLLALIPIIGSGDGDGGVSFSIIKVLLVIGGVVFGGRYLLRPAFRAIASTKTDELFTAATLLLVVGVALLMHSIGLSMALGAFLAGILLADSEYRHELEADIEPFKGLLLGLFFMAVGMSVDYGLLLRMPQTIIGLTLLLLASKVAINYTIGRLSGLNSDSARHVAMVLPQGGEFAFVVFAAAVSNRILSPDISAVLVLVVTLSMAITPFLYLINERYLDKIWRPPVKPFDEIEESEDSAVIIAGFGRFGQIVGRTLRVLGISFTALEADANQVEVLRKFGTKVYYGDASKLELLRAARTDRAKIFVIAIDDVATSLKTAAIVRQNFPHVTVFARARNRSHVWDLYDLGITKVWRETFGSSVEMAEKLLLELGLSEYRAEKTMERFRQHDERTLKEQYAVRRDEEKLIDVSKRSVQQLTNVFTSDQADSDDIRPKELH